MNKTLVAILFMLPLVGLTEPAHATAELDLLLSSNGQMMEVTGVPENNVSFVGTFAGYNLTVGGYGDETGLSLAVQVGKVAGTPAPITISITETGLVPAETEPFTSYNTAILHTASTVAFSTYYDTTNQAFGSLDYFSSGSVTGPALSSSVGPFYGTEDIQTVYSVTKNITLTPVTGAFPTLDGQLYISANEPASLGLFGVGVAGIAFTARTRKRTAPPTA